MLGFHANRLTAIAAAALLLSGCAGKGDIENSSAGTSAFEKTGITAPEPDGPLRSPSGRIVVPGTTDSLGYTLPLDVSRPKPKREPGKRPTIEQTEQKRRSAKAAAFEEHRLGPDDGHTQNETSIAADGDTLVAGWNHFTDATLVMGVARSVDGGQTWSESLFSGHNVTSDPAVRAGGNGKWYYAYLAGGGTGGSDVDIYVRRSLDGGANWESPVVVTQNNSFDDKPYIDARNDEVLVGWADFSISPAKVRVARSLDGGQTFGQETVLANNSIGGNGACPVIDPNGIYYVFWRDSFQESLWISKSTDQGATWSPDRGIVGMNPLPLTLPGGFRIVNLPSADADPLTGDLVVVWNDRRFGDPDILSIRSTDGGQSWSAPIRVNDDAGSAAQWFPWVTIDEAGVVHVVWYDRRENGFDIDVYCARSTDGGQTYEPNIRVTSAPFTPVLPWDTSTNFIGDYNGIAATVTTAYPFYQDARRGIQDVYVALLPTAPTDVTTGGITLPRPSAARLTVSPSPFRHHTRIEVTGTTSASGVEIISVAGRTIRHLPFGPSNAVEWDGRDEHGRELPAGVYLARLSGDEAAARRIVKIR